jgi:hypothetical protein
MKFTGGGIHNGLFVALCIPAASGSAYTKMAFARKKRNEVTARISDMTGTILSLSLP